MSSHVEDWPPPNDPKAFECLCLDLWKTIWNDPNAQMNGRLGQPQAGVDVFGLHCEGYVGVQCKQKNGLLRSELTIRELETEVEAARQFKPPLKSFIVATTAPKDVRLQEHARQLTAANSKDGLFVVNVWAWPDIWHELYNRPDLLSQISPKYWPLLTQKQRSTFPRLTRISALGLALIVMVIIGLFVAVFQMSRHAPLGMPVISFETAGGLPMPDEPNGSWSHNDQAHLRLHKLSIQNTNNIGVAYFDGILQLPEPVATNKPLIFKPPGVEVQWEPDIPETVTIGEVTRIGSRPLTGVWRLRVDKIPPMQTLQLSFFTTTRGAEAQNYLEITRDSRTAFSNMPPVSYFFAGKYSFDRSNATNEGVVVILKYDHENRLLTAAPAQPIAEDLNLRRIILMQ